jgi:hypothetical protein
LKNEANPDRNCPKCGDPTCGGPDDHRDSRSKKPTPEMGMGRSYAWTQHSPLGFGQ